MQALFCIFSNFFQGAFESTEKRALLYKNGFSLLHRLAQSCQMMHRLRRYDVFRLAQNDVAPVGRNDAMFAPKCGEATHH